MNERRAYHIEYLEKEMFSIAIHAVLRCTFGRYFDHEATVLKFYHDYEVVGKLINISLKIKNN